MRNQILNTNDKRLNVALALLLSLLCLALAQGVCLGATYYLDAVNGNDAWDGSLTYPWQTVERALPNDARSPRVTQGDTVIISPGNYGEVIYNENGDAGRTDWITYKAANYNNKPIINFRVYNTKNAYIKLDGIHFKFATENTAFVGSSYEYNDSGSIIWHQRPSHVHVLNSYFEWNSDIYTKYSYQVHILGADYITIEDSEVTKGRYAVMPRYSTHIVLRRLYIHDAWEDGIYTQMSSYVTVEDCYVYNTGFIAGASHQDIIGFADSDHIIVRGCKLHQGNSQGLYFTEDFGTYGSNVLIENNLIYGRILGGPLRIYRTNNVTIRNNTVVAKSTMPPPDGPIENALAGDVTGAVVYNNIFQTEYFVNNANNVQQDYNIYEKYATWGPNPKGSHDLDNTLVEFVDPANDDYRLTEASIARDFGDPAHAPATDILGNPRDAQPDAGCYEYSSGATYYVDQNHPQASDANPGTTEELPWETLTKAANTAQEGDTVLVKAGIYNETLVPANSGTTGNLITFKAYPGDNAVIDAENKNFAVDLNWKSYIRIEGFEIRNSNTYGIRIIAGSNNIGLEIVNNNIHHNSKTFPWPGAAGGITVSKATDLLIQDNEIHHNDENGIYIETTTEEIINPRIIGNHIYSNDHDGIKAGGGRNWLIEGNIIHDHDDPKKEGVHADNIQVQRGNLNGLVIRNNIFWDATQNIYVANHIYGTIENVEIYGNLIYTDDFSTGGAQYRKGIFLEGRTTSSSYVKNAKIYGNTIYDMYFGILIGINVEGNITIRNNILSKSIQALSVHNTPALTVNSNYNLVNGGAISWYGTFYNTFSQFQQATDLEPNSFDADPEFVNTANFDFHLKSTSPAIDAGDPNLATLFTLPDPFLDLDGNPRLYGMGYDIGAYEYTLLPRVVISAQPEKGYLPLKVLFSISQLITPNGEIERWEWDFGDGAISYEKEPSHIYTSSGEYTATLIVTDIQGYRGRAQTHIKVLKKEKEFQEISIGCYNNVINPIKGEEALIWIELPKQARVKISLYNTRGNRIRELADEEEDADVYQYYWDGKDDNGNIVGSGLYFVHIQAGDYKKTKKIVVVK